MEEKNGIAEVIKQLILECLNEQQQRIGDLSKLDAKTLIAMEQTLRFWCADAIIRLILLPEDSNLDPWKLYYKAEEVAENLNLDELTKCYLHTRDEKTLIGLIYFRTDVVAFQKEIETRFTRQSFGKAFAYFLDHPNDREALNRVLKIIGQQESALLRKMHWTKSRNIAKQLKALKAEEYDSYEDREKESYPIKTAMDHKNEAILIMFDLYDKLKRAILLDDIKLIPSSVIKDFRKPSNRIWDEQESIIREKLIQTEIKTKLPILSGKMETVPLKVYDSQRTEDLHETIRVEVKASEKEEYPTGFKRIKRTLPIPDSENVDARNEADDGDRLDKFSFKTDKIEGKDEFTQENEITERIYQDDLRKHGKINKELADDQRILLSWIEDKLKGHEKTNKKLMKYFELIILNKMPKKEALKKAKLSYRTLHDHIKKLQPKLDT